MEADDAALRAHYERGMERERLSDGRGDLEFTRTTEIVLRRIDGMLRERLYRTYPAALDLIDEIDGTGGCPN
jgi:hypothetical protein